jgi:hypothetical protein
VCIEAAAAAAVEEEEEEDEAVDASDAARASAATSSSDQAGGGARGRRRAIPERQRPDLRVRVHSLNFEAYERLFARPFRERREKTGLLLLSCSSFLSRRSSSHQR